MTSSMTPYSETVEKNGTEILYLMCHPFQPLVGRGKGTRQRKCYRFKPSKQPYFLLLFNLHIFYFSGLLILQFLLHYCNDNLSHL